MHDRVHQLLGDMECFGDTQNANQINADVVGGNVFANNTELRRQVFRPFAFHILLCPYLVMVFTSGRKELQLPEFELRVLSSRSKSFITKSPDFCKNQVCAFLYSHGPRTQYLPTCQMDVSYP